MSYTYTAAVTLLALLLLYGLVDGGRPSAWKIPHQGAGRHRSREFRARLPGADEHCGTDGVLPAGAVALRGAAFRHVRRGRRIDLGYRPRRLCGLLAGPS